MGYRTSRVEIEDAMHFWRYVGHLMGVHPRWFPANVREALQLAFVTFLKNAERSGEDGKRLCQSYVDAFTPSDDPTRPWTRRVADAFEHGVYRGYTRVFMPPHLSTVASSFLLRGSGRCEPAPDRARTLLARGLLAAETLRRRSSKLDALADRVARIQRRRWLDRQLEGRSAAFKPVESFQR